MVRARLGRIAATVLIGAMLAAGVANGSRAQSADDIRALNDQVTELYGQGEYAEATAIAQRALTLAERALGKENRETLLSVNNLAVLYQVQGRYDEAEPLSKRALAARERLLGKDHPDTIQSVNNLAELYHAQGRYSEAEPLLKRALEASERVQGKEHPWTLAAVDNLARLYHDEGRYAQAEPLNKRALAGYERALGAEHPDTLTSVNNLAGLYRDQGRYGEAEPLYKRALDARERVLGAEHPDTLQSVANLAEFYQAQGRYSEAEPLFKRAIETYERVLGKEHPETIRSVYNLAFLYQAQDRYAEAEPLYLRAKAGYERALGPEHPDTLTVVENLAGLYQSQGRYGEAEPLLRHVLAVRERVLGKAHPDTLRSVNDLAVLYESQGHYAQAESLLKRVMAAFQRALGPDHPDTLASVDNLAVLYSNQGRYREAEPLLKTVVAGYERVLGAEHPDTFTGVRNLALLYFSQGDWVRAAQFWRRSTSAIDRHLQRGVRDASHAVTGKKKSEEEQRTQFAALVKAVSRISPEGRTPDAASSREMFQTAQWAQSSEAGASLAQMAARGAKGDAKLAALARERQDLVEEWQKRDELRVAAIARASDKRDAKAEADNSARLSAIDARIAGIDKELAANYPDYAALASPAPITVEEVQTELGADEALVLFLVTPGLKPTPEETFTWVVTKTDMRWVRSDLGTLALIREVLTLRCGLDATAWEDKPCKELTGQSYTDAARDAGKPLPFDFARAHALYKALFGQAEDLIKGKSLIIVPSGPLTQLPFQVLVTKPAQDGDYKSAAWLIRDHALTVLPAVSSLKALRRVGRPSAAAKPMIGFGNPLLDGDPADADAQQRAVDARNFKRCPVPERVASNERSVRGVAPVVTRGGLADTGFLRMQVPLPETAYELCAVARDVHADPGDIYLGARATEREVKHLSETGKLAQYRIVHFATHGALAGQVTGNTEPGLILTPPKPPAEPSEEDDGYLTASEIAGLKLDADWVILSACNTAAGGARGAEALSGLARAFIYAQARALLVSHWEVASDATVKLITGAMQRIAADKSMGRAEAMRESMLALIDHGKPYEAHPAFWAPFVVVGEGGAAR